MINKLNTNSFTLVLSGGGALGIAHLGVMHDLEAKKIVPIGIGASVNIILFSIIRK